MNKLRFSDGEEFDTSGKMRTEKRSDGWYVIGGGLLMAVDTKAQGEKFIEEHKEGKQLGG